VVSSSLVIEAHRQLVDFTRQKHQSEMETVRSLWRIYALEGRLLAELKEWVR
jgi:cobalt-zinc-cadmium efflux system outer membrane protein